MPKVSPIRRSIASHSDESLMRDLDTVFDALSHSNFRKRFRLGAREEAYLRERGMTEVIGHARELITRRLAPEQPPNPANTTPHGLRPRGLIGLSRDHSKARFFFALRDNIFSPSTKAENAIAA